ncbi:hypothetical protein VL20_2363 [Microcystis panniformis FACHB-1757]|uniref:Uncharacterized protein n=1 Tax=Microcystis panniformis FACHB-1757 TaxID=1638788 RepID=A0A0K1S0B6_9CHRO|nr:hypothetical protein VL20_2363 [Microcystis panniformis FACHB-1757]
MAKTNKRVTKTRVWGASLCQKPQFWRSFSQEKVAMCSIYSVISYQLSVISYQMNVGWASAVSFCRTVEA